MKEGGLPPPPAFQFLILRDMKSLWFNFSHIICTGFKIQDFKLQFIKRLKTGIPILRIAFLKPVKVLQQALHVIRIKHQKGGGSQVATLILALWNKYLHVIEQPNFRIPNPQYFVYKLDQIVGQDFL